MTTSLPGFAQTVARRLLRVLLSALSGVLIAHALGPDGRGDYAIITTTVLLAMVIGHFSIERTQIAWWADEDRRPPLTVNALVIGAVLGTVTALTGIALTLAGVLPTRSPLLCVALLAVPFAVVTVNLTAIALLRAQVSLVTRGSVISGLLQFVPAVLLAATHHLTLSAAVLSWAVSLSVPAVLLARALGPFPLRGGDVRLARAQLAVGGRQHVGLVAFHFLLIVDVLLLHELDSAAAAGIYAVAVTLLELTRIPGESLTQIVLARQAVADLPDAEQVTARTVRLNLLLSSGLIACLMAVSPLLIPLLYGRAFAGSVAPLLALAPGMVILIVLRPIEQHLVRLDRPGTLTVIAVTALAVNVALNLLLIPHFGAVGAGLVSSVSYALMAILEARWFVRSAGLSYAQLVPRPADLGRMLRALRRDVAAAGRGARKEPGRSRRTADRTTARPR
ncbi:polysaccharide biosynthesis protein [Sphaerisporangium melleum]|uniref:Polysaccharide biosynthesis protein n=1 Tax=Sphaerisporangium melleum TaxID=321316 RepID=A0A917QTF3_9ACTN|nr:polysaccharide biosynthesis protein [Sphaerisporangium melleum]GII68472.1 polysaccharide biosynthesis protein [Sphaerisporangium melleum]